MGMGLGALGGGISKIKSKPKAMEICTLFTVTFGNTINIIIYVLGVCKWAYSLYVYLKVYA